MENHSCGLMRAALGGLAFIGVASVVFAAALAAFG